MHNLTYLLGNTDKPKSFCLNAALGLSKTNRPRDCAKDCLVSILLCRHELLCLQLLYCCILMPVGALDPCQTQNRTQPACTCIIQYVFLHHHFFQVLGGKKKGNMMALRWVACFYAANGGQGCAESSSGKGGRHRIERVNKLRNVPSGSRPLHQGTEIRQVETRWDVSAAAAEEALMGIQRHSEWATITGYLHRIHIYSKTSVEAWHG